MTLFCGEGGLPTVSPGQFRLHRSTGMNLERPQCLMRVDTKIE